MMKRLIGLGTIGLALTCSAHAQDPDQKPAWPGSTSLCQNSEQTVFKCDTDQGQIALCASGQNLQYRFDQPGLRDSHYPDTPQPASEAFNGDSMTFPDGDGIYITFVQNNQRITVLTALGVSGLSIKKGAFGEREVSNALCHAQSVYSAMDKDFLASHHMVRPQNPAPPPHGDYTFRVPFAFYQGQ